VEEDDILTPTDSAVRAPHEALPAMSKSNSNARNWNADGGAKVAGDEGDSLNQAPGAQSPYLSPPKSPQEPVL
jgi:hypothetical protein